MSPPPPPCLDVSMQRETKKEMERGERGRWRGRGSGERNGLVSGVRLFFQSALRPARFTPLLRMDFSQWRIFDQSSFRFDFCDLKLKYHLSIQMGTFYLLQFFLPHSVTVPVIFVFLGPQVCFLSSYNYRPWNLKLGAVKFQFLHQQAK